jgi:hypothetical protein
VTSYKGNRKQLKGSSVSNRVVRGTATVCVLLVAFVALAWSTPTAGMAWSGRPADAQVAAAAGILAWFVLAWLLVASVVSACSSMPGAAGSISGAVARRVAPAVLRRVVASAVGVVIATSVSLPTAALAGPPQLSAHVSAATGTVTARAAGEIGDRRFVSARTSADGEAPADFDRTAASSLAQRVTAAPKRRAALAVVQGVPRGDAAAGDVVVRRGDSLWSIAAAELGPSASAAHIEQRWRRWYSVNRATIGADPDLILPGTRLVRPPSPAD